MAIEQIKRFPATISQPILQLMAEWSFLNFSGYRYDLLDSPNCPICKTPETTQHYLIDCIVFESKRESIRKLFKQHRIPFTLKIFLESHFLLVNNATLSIYHCMTTFQTLKGKN